MAGNFTLFTNDSGAASGANSYVADVFKDVTLPASNNTSLTSNALTNPLGDQFANNDTALFGAKTLYIKDLVLISDRSKWIDNKPTYRIIWNKVCPQVSGYFFGNVLASSKTGTPMVTIKTIGDGIGTTGIISKLAWIVNDDTSATATAQIKVDGVNTTTISFSGINSDSDTQNIAKQSVYVNSGSNATQDLHDYQLTALQASTLKIIGVVVYFENAGQNIEQRPGTTYNDKSKVSTTVGATLALPTYGSSLGGKALLYKTQQSAYVLSALSASTVVSIAQGLANTNLLTVTTGHGASFPAGSGLVVSQGATTYVGAVTNVSTDTLTMSPTLSFGLSGSVYRAWMSGSTFPISSSYMILDKTIEFSQYSGLTNPIFDPCLKYAVWGNNVGITNVDSVAAAYFVGASGFLQMDGDFAAADMEMIGNAISDVSVNIQGTPGWSFQGGQTGAIRRTLFSEGGPGWHSVRLIPGVSMGAIGINRINLYKRAHDLGVTFGILAELETNQAFASRPQINATTMALGVGQRVFADQLYLKGPWSRGVSAGVAGGVFYYGTSTNSILKFDFYGKNIAVLGTPGGGTLTLDGAGLGLTFGFMHVGATEMFHTLQYTSGSGGTAIVEAVEFTRSYGDIEQIFNPLVQEKAIKVLSELYIQGGNGLGSGGSNKIRRYLNIRKNIGDLFTYVDDPVNGGYVIINRTAPVAVTAIEGISGGAVDFGISVNDPDITAGFPAAASTNPENYPATDSSPSTASVSNAAFQTTLNRGDVIRVHTDGQAGGTLPRISLRLKELPPGSC